MATEQVEQPKYIGRVRWYDRKKGFGFVSITDGERAGDDIFVHHTEVQSEHKQFCFLVEGEYVEFSIEQRDTNDEKPRVVATHITGVKGGKLLCETRYDSYMERKKYREDRNEPHHKGNTRGRGRRRAGNGRSRPRGRAVEKKEE